VLRKPDNRDNLGGRRRQSCAGKLRFSSLLWDSRASTRDPRGIPTGSATSFGRFNAQLGEVAFDDGFALIEEEASFSVSGGGRRITVEFLVGYSYAQVFAPKDKDYIALEPMTAPASALTSGHGLRLAKAGEQFRAAFRIRVEG
jgi:aldose 1-epimerase